MALEINEIGIRMHVGDGRSEAEPESGGQAGGGQDETATTVDRDEIVEDCVRRVLRALKSAQER